MQAYKVYSDLELISLLKMTDEGALSELYNRYWDKLLVVCLNRLKDINIAQEIVQDIFTRLWERREDLKIETSVSIYLSVAVKYKVVDYLGSKYYREHQSEIKDDYALTFEPSFEEELFNREMMRHIEMSISDLPAKCQLVFRMSRESDMTYKQISEELNISTKTVEAHISKAIKTIRANLNLLIVLLISEYLKK